MSQESPDFEKIKSSKRFCILPWMHIHISPSGELFSCCRTDFKTPLGSFKENSLKEIWNSEQSKLLRKKMLNDEFIQGCSDCYQQEEKNITSLRQNSNRDFESLFYLVAKTEKGGALTEFNPQYLDLRFDNICNFKCRTCGPNFSTSWYADYKKLNLTINDSPQRISDNTDRLWRELSEIIPNVQRIYFAGGEPILEKDHYLLLKLLLHQNKNNVTLTYNTNFSKFYFQNENILDYWKKFNDVWVHASLDGVEKKAEYIRKGTRWDDIRRNRDLLREHCPHVKFRIYYTLSVFNAFHLIEALHYFVKNNFISDWSQFEVNMLNEPDIYNAKLFNEFERDKLKLLYNDFINNDLPKITLKNQDFLINQLRYILQFISDDDFSDKRKIFMAFNNKLDEIRNDSLVTLFPELINFTNSIKPSDNYISNALSGEKMKFTTETTIQLNDDVICRANQDGTVVVMKMNEDEFFYKINGVAADIWLKLSTKPKSLSEVANEVAEEYEVSPEKIMEDSQDFLNKALRLSFIKIN